ncbi:HET-domain-containing protein [Apiospora saccharicola]
MEQNQGTSHDAEGVFGQSSHSQPTPQPATPPSEDVDLDPYVYRPLDASKKEIRLVTVLPGEHGSPIEVTLHHVSLNSPAPQTLPTVMSLKEVRATLPKGWSAYQTLRDRIMFQGKSVPQSDWESTWVHPDPQVSQTAYDITMHPPPSREGIPDFEALSYAWGSLDLTAAVVVHDNFDELAASQPLPSIQSGRRMLPVGENLHEALLYLRLPDEPRVMWIDALCINQNDPEERGHQVKRMVHIYSCARKVVAWIGPEYDNAAKAMEGLAHIGNQLEILDDSWTAPSPGASEPSWHRPQVSLPFDTAFWATVSSLFDRPWFWRLWVIQEIHIGNLNASLKCGAHEMTWLQFRHAIICLIPKNPPPIALHRLYRLHWMCLRNFRGGFADRLRTLGCKSRYSDPRDIIYGLISLAPPELQDAIRVDYEIDVKSIYREFFITYTDLQFRSDLLIFSGCSRTGENTSELWPSWIPDWRILRKAMRSQTDPLTSAAGLSCAEMTWNSKSDDQLRVQGVIVDTVSSIQIEDCWILRTVIQRLVEMQDQRTLEAIEHDGDDSLFGSVESYIEALLQGCTKDRIIDAPTWAAPSPKHFRQDVIQNRGLSMDSKKTFPAWWAAFQSSAAQDLQDLKLSGTRKGHAAGPELTVVAGDCLFVPLGCSAPIAIRRQRNMEGHTYRLVGPVYVSGLMDGEALLGELPDTWRILYDTFHRYADEGVLYKNLETGSLVKTDPRLESIPLPEEWEPVAWTRKEIDPAICCRFKNKATGELINYDPRMTGKALKERGVDIQEITLV